MSPRLLPDWIQAYLAYTGESESPEEFHAWIAISTIAGVLRRRTYFDMGYFNLYPNLYIVLVSPPGLCKKSTAMRISRPIYSLVPGVNFSVDSTTRERMILDMASSFADGQSALTAYSTEFASLLTSSGMDMVVFLTDIYDSPNEWAHKTKIGGTNLIKFPFLNLLAGTTPDWLAKAMPLDTIGIGLTSRVIFVYSETPRVKPPFPVLSPAQRQLADLLCQDLMNMSLLSGQFTLTPSAKSFYEDWYMRRHEETKLGDTRLSGYFERKPMHAIKVAMCLSAAVKDDLILTEDDLKRSLEMLATIEQHMPRVFVGVGKNPLAADMEYILGVILSNRQGVTVGQLLDMFRHSVRKEELEEILETLRITGHVQQQPGPMGVLYVPTSDIGDIVGKE